MDRSFWLTTVALTMLWFSGFRGGQGQWLVSVCELVIFYLIIGFAVNKEK